jgi:hypothetical protein
MSSFIKIRPVGDARLHADRGTHGHDETSSRASKFSESPLNVSLIHKPASSVIARTSLRIQFVSIVKNSHGEKLLMYVHISVRYSSFLSDCKKYRKLSTNFSTKSKLLSGIKIQQMAVTVTRVNGYDKCKR